MENIVSGSRVALVALSLLLLFMPWYLSMLDPVFSVAYIVLERRKQWAETRGTI